jgi:hypothetical protein
MDVVIYINVHTHTHIIYIYIYTHTHTHTYIHIYTYTLIYNIKVPWKTSGAPSSSGAEAYHARHWTEAGTKGKIDLHRRKRDCFIDAKETAL